VWLDPKTDKPIPISDGFRKLVEGMEGRNVQIYWPTHYA
jgi:hypothetical protein